MVPQRPMKMTRQYQAAGKPTSSQALNCFRLLPASSRHLDHFLLRAGGFLSSLYHTHDRCRCHCHLASQHQWSSSAAFWSAAVVYLKFHAEHDHRHGAGGRWAHDGAPLIHREGEAPWRSVMARYECNRSTAAVESASSDRQLKTRAKPGFWPVRIKARVGRSWPSFGTSAISGVGHCGMVERGLNL